jgi:hypothetical protein
MKTLFDKYTVKKNVGETDPKAEYFVLRIDKDPHARVALRAYSRSIQDAAPEFSDALMGWVDRCEAAQHSLQSDGLSACAKCEYKPCDGVPQNHADYCPARC